MASVNILLTSRVVEHFRGKHKHLKISDADGEIGAYGIANMVAGIFAAPMSVGIPARSLASVRCGGVTRMSNLFHGVFILGFVIVGNDYISHIPIPGTGGGHRIYRHLSFGMEYLATLAQNAPRRCTGVS